MKHRHAFPFAIVLGIAGLVQAFPGTDEDQTIFDFTAGQGRPKFIDAKGPNQDGNTPFQDDPHFVRSVAPGDQLILNVQPPPKIIGRILAHKANFVKISRESSFFGLFSSEKRDNHPDEQWSQRKKTLQVGAGANEIRVVLELYKLKHKAKKADPLYRVCFKPGQPVDIYVPYPGDVYVSLQVADDLVAWQDRAPNTAEQKELDAEMRSRQRAYQMDEATMLTPPKVLRGNVGAVKAELIVLRGK